LAVAVVHVLILPAVVVALLGEIIYLFAIILVII